MFNGFHDILDLCLLLTYDLLLSQLVKFLLLHLCILRLHSIICIFFLFLLFIDHLLMLFDGEFHPIMDVSMQTNLGVIAWISFTH